MSMQRLFVLVMLVASCQWTMAQDSASTKKQKKDWSKVNLTARSRDHLLLQLGYNFWTQTPDSINTKGIPLSFNAYFMFDFPFKTAPHISVGIGAGVGTDNQYFDKTIIDLTGREVDRLTFTNSADTNHFKKYKMNTTYLEAPIELRYMANPENTNKGFKAAIGVKVGTLVSAMVRGKTYQTKDGTVINNYTDKEKSKRYINSTRISATARIGWGFISAYASYQVNPYIKEGFGPSIRPFAIGLTISGL